MSLPNPGMDFTPLDTLPAASLDDMVENIEALAAGTGLNNGAVTFAKLASNIFSGQLTTYTNPGTAGGTNSFFYMNLGGIKVMYGMTADHVSSNAAPTYTVTLPSGYFTTVKAIISTAVNMTGDARQYISTTAFSTSTITLCFNAPNGAATTTASLLVIGT